MNKKTVIGVSIGAVIAVVAGIYFFAVPAVLVSNYKQTVASKHSELNESINKLGAVLESDTFIKSEIEPAKIQSDVKKANELIKNTEAKLASVKKDLTSFTDLPLLDVNSKYSAAKSLKSDEVTYISKTEAYVAELKQVVAYLDKDATIGVKLEETVKGMEKSFETAETPAAVAAVIDTAVNSIQPLFDEYTKIVPPASLKASHEFEVTQGKVVIDLLKQLAAAARAGNGDKIVSLGEQFEAKSEEVKKKQEEFKAQFVRESELRKLDDALNQLDREIGGKEGSL